MSRIGKNPVALPKGVEATIAQGEVSIKGPLGTLSRRLVRSVAVEKSGESLVFRATDGVPEADAM